MLINPNFTNIKYGHKFFIKKNDYQFTVTTTSFLIWTSHAQYFDLKIKIVIGKKSSSVYQFTFWLHPKKEKKR